MTEADARSARLIRPGTLQAHHHLGNDIFLYLV